MGDNERPCNHQEPVQPPGNLCNRPEPVQPPRTCLRLNGYIYRVTVGESSAVQETTLRVKLSGWPSPQDYNESVQNPHFSLCDDELQSANVLLDARGLPRPVTGAFASVYRFQCKQRDVALRCFLTGISDQELRYALIADFVKKSALPCVASFEFLKQGISVGGSWYPALKMDWVEGATLDRFLYENLGDGERIATLAANFRQLTQCLTSLGTAHGDLQHANILVTDAGELRLVDYDGMFVPGMQGLQSSESGHVNYQHPARSGHHFGAYLDNFSAWNIYTSILALQLDPELWNQLQAGDDCLLFRRSDFLTPLESPAFASLESHACSELRQIARFLRSQLAVEPSLVPPLQESIPAVDSLEPLPDDVPRRRVSVRIKKGDWFEWSDSPGDDADVSRLVGYSTRIEPELQGAVPRAIVYNRSHRQIDPKLLRKLVLVNPLFWFFLGYFTQAALLDPWPRTVNAMVLSSTAYKDKNGDKHDRIRFEYFNVYSNAVSEVVDPPEAKVRPIQIGAWRTLTLPNNPDILWHFFMAFVLCLATWWCDKLIARSGVRDSWFAKNASPALGEIIMKETNFSRFGSVVYNLVVRFDTGSSGSYQVKLKVDQYEYRNAAEGEFVTILFDPAEPVNAMLYRDCRYQAVKLS